MTPLLTLQSPLIGSSSIDVSIISGKTARHIVASMKTNQRIKSLSGIQRITIPSTRASSPSTVVVMTRSSRVCPYSQNNNAFALSNDIALTATTLPFRFCISIEVRHGHHFFSEEKGSRPSIAENGRNSPSLE